VPDSFNQELLLSPKTKFPAYDLSVKPDKSYTTVITYMFGSSFKKPGYYGYCDDDLAHLIIGFRRQYDEGRIWLALLDGVTFQEYLFDQLSQGAYSQYPRDYLLYCLSFLETRPASGTNPPHIQHCTYGQYPSNIACAIVTAPNSRAGSGQTLLQSSKPLARKAGNEKLPVKNRQLFTKRQQTAQTPGTPDKKRRRGKFTPEQKRILESAFKENNYLPPKGQQRIAAKAKMTTIQVRDWFQNRRKEEKKKMNSSLATTLQQYFHTPVNSINVAGIAGIAGIAGSSFAQVLARSYQQLPPLVLASAPDSGAQGYNSPFAYPLQTITNNDNPASGPLFSEPSSSESKDEGEQNQPGSSLTQPDLTMDGEPVEMERNEEGYVHFKRIKKN
ncbi:homeobox domain-containing protein, partial [Endozoicomonas montiporae]